MTEPKQLSEIHAVILKPAERLRIGEDLTNTIQKKEVLEHVLAANTEVPKHLVLRCSEAQDAPAHLAKFPLWPASWLQGLQGHEKRVGFTCDAS